MGRDWHGTVHDTVHLKVQLEVVATMNADLGAPAVSDSTLLTRSRLTRYELGALGRMESAYRVVSQH